jgi:predicted transcriptional regulator
MSTLELKNKIKGKVEKIDNKSILELIYQFVANQEDNSKPYKLTEGQIAGNKRGLADVKAGRLISNESFQKELDEWLAKEK